MSTWNDARVGGHVAVGGASGELTGRIAFGAMGVLVLLIALVAWRRVFRARNGDDQVG